MYYGGQFNESRFYVLHQDFLRYVRNRSASVPKKHSHLSDLLEHSQLIQHPKNVNNGR